ncbi:hypothetical protein [uncultured Maricaulis sp.]|uniref:hypothetical protein n=1 Tax=uncultured Maricaulis sp. TaxID=174710 RepID=UPI0030DA2448|tara:strand:- start:201166 stop:201912 length:747 start_codon:yes stop_codon:yes gene_type:complete
MTIKTARKWTTGLVGASLLLALAGCGQSQTTSPAAETASSTPAPAQMAAPAETAAPVASSTMSPAARTAEAFEATTEQAFSADASQLHALLAETKAAVAQLRPSLPAATAEQLDVRNNEIELAIQAGNSVDIAIAAVEGFRLTVESMPGDANHPQQVSLLDYAGFRIQADLTATPPRWDDTDAAIAYADGQWAEIAGQLSDLALRDRFAASLAALRAAIETRNLDVATTAVTLELDLVDELESAFAGQ